VRRLAVLLLGTLAILSATDATALAQAADKVYRLGLLSPSAGTFERMRAGVLPELARLGFTEGKNLVVKRLYLLHEAIPGVRRLGALAVNAARDSPNTTAVKEAAERASIELLLFYGAQEEDYPSAFAEMRRAGADALQILSAPELYTHASKLAALAVDAGLPTICEWAEMARSGCLLGYGPDRAELQRRVANYVVRILRGASPGELPIEGPTHFQFTVNLKIAKVLGLTIPAAILARADEVIE
jgi:putative ABC transport system substrate-binding protein